METGVKNPFSFRQQERPFLSPLGRQRTFPAVAAPVVLTICGGVALVLTFGALFGVRPGLSPLLAETEIQQDERETPPLQTASPDDPVVTEEEPAQVTALPQSPEAAEGGDPVLVPILPDGGPDGGPDGRTEAFAGEAEPDVAEMDSIVPDADRTAAIAPSLPDEISSFAPQPRPSPPAARDTPAPPPVAEARATAMRPAVVNRAVNLRAAPNKGGRVMMVVPASAEIQAQRDCGWCEISYRGQSGFIYKSFITYR